MAVESYKSNHTDGVSRLHPIDRQAKVRYHYFKVAAANVANLGDINSTFELGKLPYGRIRVLPSLSSVQVSAFGAARVMSFGHRAYATEQGVTVAEDAVAFGSALDVSAAAVKVLNSADLAFDIFSRAGVDVFAKVTGGQVPIGSTIEGYIAYLTD